MSLLGYWAVVSATDWSWEDATVVCRALGYNGSGEALTGLLSESFGRSEWLTQFRCTGNETSLKFCPYMVAVKNNPSYFKAEVACGNKTGAKKLPTMTSRSRS